MPLLLRKYREEDLAEILRLFYDTVHFVNAADYTKPQLDAWADGKPDFDLWNRSLLSHYTLVAVSRGSDGEKIVGFGDIDGGYFDRLYVHRDYVGRGVGTLLADALEKHAFFEGISEVTVHASITARPFFEKRGYLAAEKNTVMRRGVAMCNFTMKKSFESALENTKQSGEKI